jgi:catechol 2,3-dioxygenase-like lactoylglutathione lyase family enzyme
MTIGYLPGLSSVDHVALTVPDLDRAINFYHDVFGASELYRLGPFDSADLPLMPDGCDWSEAHVNVPGARLTLAMLQLGPNLLLELFQYEKPEDARKTPPRNCDLGGHHIAFRVRDLEAAKAFLREKSVRLMAGPIVISGGPNPGMKVQYFLDPWGNQLELVEY